MQLTLLKPLIFLDTETTGLDFKEDRIIELAAIKLFPDGTKLEKCRRFNPLKPIPEDATAVHGITDDDVKNEPHFSKVAKSIAQFFNDCDLAGYNIVNFDIPMIAAEMERAKVPFDLSESAVIDVYKIFISREPRNLKSALKFYCNREHEKAHSALGDVQATFDVLCGQIEKYPNLPRDPKGLDLSVRDDSWVDRLGKLRWSDGKVVLAFGRNKGKTLEVLFEKEPDYLKWLVDNDVIQDAKKCLRDAILGIFPQKK